MGGNKRRNNEVILLEVRYQNRDDRTESANSKRINLGIIHFSELDFSKHEDGQKIRVGEVHGRI